MFKSKKINYDHFLIASLALVTSSIFSRRIIKYRKYATMILLIYYVATVKSLVSTSPLQHPTLSSISTESNLDGKQVALINI